MAARAQAPVTGKGCPTAVPAKHHGHHIGFGAVRFGTLMGLTEKMPSVIMITQLWPVTHQFGMRKCPHTEENAGRLKAVLWEPNPLPGILSSGQPPALSHLGGNSMAPVGG